MAAGFNYRLRCGAAFSVTALHCNLKGARSAGERRALYFSIPDVCEILIPKGIQMKDHIIDGELVEIPKAGQFLDLKFQSGKVARIRLVSIEQGEAVDLDFDEDNEIPHDRHIPKVENLDESGVPEAPKLEKPENDESGVPLGKGKPDKAFLENLPSESERTESETLEPPAAATDESNPKGDSET